MWPRAILGVVVLCSFGPARAESLPPKIDEAIDRAAAEHKTLLVEIYTTWCGPCRIFETDTLTDPRVQKALANVALVRYDAELPIGIAVVERYGARAYPTFLAIDKHRAERLRREGVFQVESFLKLVADAHKAVRADTH
jgi:thiol:disulfide interchange protein